MAEQEVLAMDKRDNPERYGTVLGQYANNPGCVEVVPFNAKMRKRALANGAWVPVKSGDKGPKGLQDLF